MPISADPEKIANYNNSKTAGGTGATSNNTLRRETSDPTMNGNSLSNYDFSFSFTKLSSLPADIALLRDAIRKLDLSNNQLTSLSLELFQLVNLESLNISFNRLTVIPNEISQLKELRLLNISNNLLESLPDSIGQLSHILILNVESNQLRALPVSLGKCSSLSNLTVSNNQLLFPPQQVLNGGLNEMKEFLNFIDDDRQTAISRCKLLILGAELSGKSSVIRALDKKHRKKKLISTGLAIHNWTLEITNIDEESTKQQQQQSSETSPPPSSPSSSSSPSSPSSTPGNSMPGTPSMQGSHSHSHSNSSNEILPLNPNTSKTKQAVEISTWEFSGKRNHNKHSLSL